MLTCANQIRNLFFKYVTTPFIKDFQKNFHKYFVGVYDALNY